MRFDALIELRGNGDNATTLELALITLWQEMNGYEELAADGATELTQLRAERDAAVEQFRFTARYFMADGSPCWCEESSRGIPPDYEHSSLCNERRAFLASLDKKG